MMNTPYKYCNHLNLGSFQVVEHHNHKNIEADFHHIDHLVFS